MMSGQGSHNCEDHKSNPKRKKKGIKKNLDGRGIGYSTYHTDDQKKPIIKIIKHFNNTNTVPKSSSV